MSRPAGSGREPPRLARRLLERMLPPEVRDDVCGDLLEIFGRRRAEQGARRARLWYWREALSFAGRFGWERIRERRGRRGGANAANPAATAGGRRAAVAASASSAGGRRATRLLAARVSLLDFKLGFRMLVKYPGLTVVGGFAMAFAICVGAATFEFASQAFSPTLPLPAGERIVGIQNRDVRAGRAEPRMLHDVATWRTELRSVEDLGAFRTVTRNLITPESSGEPVDVAELSASAFRMARVPPLLGRGLVAADEVAGAPPVVVIGYDVWQRRFGGDPDVIGRVVALGSERAVVVGVMPQGFAFPVAHGVWVPLRLNPLDYGRREGPRVQVFGRLAPGASLAEAQAELSALGQRMAAAFPDTHEHLRPQVAPYALSAMGMAYSPSGELIDLSGIAFLLRTSFNVPLVLFLVLVCGNVALLMFARAATRESEIVVRNALGASRGRIVAQLFAEALVLGGVAAVVGLAAAGFALRWAIEAFRAGPLDGMPLPFWFHASLSPETILYAALLTVLGAGIAGVVPALKVTRGLGTRLRQATAGGGGFRFGGLWTVVVVSQIAFTVPAPLIFWGVGAQAARIRAVDVGFPEQEYLAVELELDRRAGEEGIRAGGEETLRLTADSTGAAFATRFQAVVQELERRLTAEPAVAGVTFADRIPRTHHPFERIELDAGPAAPPDPRWAAYRVRHASVAPDFFEVLGVPILEGRAFTSSDLAADARVVIVNRAFVERVLGGHNPVGRLLRYVEEREESAPSDEPWYEIVGVVPDVAMDNGDAGPQIPGFYYPAPPGGTLPARMIVHVRGEPASFAPRLRALALAVDPALRLHDPIPLDRVIESELRFYAFWIWFVAVVTAIAVVLSLAGIYAVMAFTVVQRTREIGIRIVLGANRRRLVLEIFRRPLVQVVLGVLCGAAVIVGLPLALDAEVSVTLKDVAVLVAYTTLMLAVCMLAWIVPTRRALGIEPVEALRVEG